MATTWIVAADASRARILQVADPGRLVEVEALVNPDARLRVADYLDKAVRKLVLDEVPKDLSWFNAREIERCFAKGSGRAP